MEGPRSSSPANQTARKATIAAIMESLTGRVQAAPRKIPSQVKAAQPKGGIISSHQR